MLRTLSDPILSLIYPQECRVCAREVEHSQDGVACSECWNTTTIFDGNETLCIKCGAFLFAGQSSRATNCRRCDDQLFDRAFAVGLYEKALATSLLQLKRTPYLPLRLTRLIADTVERIPLDPSTVIVPIPLSRRRLRERGFNQAATIARLVSRATALLTDEVSLGRSVHTPMHRAGMDRKARAMTVKNAFQVTRPRIIEGRNLLLVDDIFTSGETASSCAKALKKSGALTVNVLTVARAG